MAQIENMDWVSVQAEVWKPEQAGDFIQGVLLAKEKSTGMYESEAYYIENNGKTLVVFGTTVLESRMKLVQVGDVVKIVYKGIEKNKRNEDMKIFEVFKGRNKSDEAIVEEKLGDEKSSSSVTGYCENRF